MLRIEVYHKVIKNKIRVNRNLLLKHIISLSNPFWKLFTEKQEIEIVFAAVISALTEERFSTMSHDNIVLFRNNYSFIKQKCFCNTIIIPGIFY